MKKIFTLFALTVLLGVFGASAQGSYTVCLNTPGHFTRLAAGSSEYQATDAQLGSGTMYYSLTLYNNYNIYAELVDDCEIASIVQGSTTLTAGTDYTVSGNVVTIPNATLAGKSSQTIYFNTTAVSGGGGSEDTGLTYTFNCEYDALNFIGSQHPNTFALNVNYDSAAKAYTVTGMQGGLYQTIQVSAKDGYTLDGVTDEAGTNVTAYYGTAYINVEDYPNNTTFDVAVTNNNAGGGDEDNGFTYTVTCDADVLSFFTYVYSPSYHKETIDATYADGAYTITGVTLDKYSTIYAEIKDGAAYKITGATGGAQFREGMVMISVYSYQQDTTFGVTVEETGDTDIVYTVVCSQNVAMVFSSENANMNYTDKGNGTYVITGVTKGDTDAITAEIRTSGYKITGVTAEGSTNAISFTDTEFSFSPVTYNASTTFNVTIEAISTDAVTIEFSNAAQVSRLYNDNFTWSRGDETPVTYELSKGTSLTVTPLNGYRVVSVTANGTSLVAAGTTLPSTEDVVFSLAGLTDGATVTVTTDAVPTKTFTFITEPAQSEEILNIACGTNTATFENGTYTIEPDANNNNVTVAIASDYKEKFEIADVTVSATGESVRSGANIAINPESYADGTEFTVTVKAIATGKKLYLVFQGGQQAQYAKVETAYFEGDEENAFSASIGAPVEVTVPADNTNLVVVAGSTNADYSGVITEVMANGQPLVDSEDLDQAQVTVDLSNVNAGAYVIFTLNALPNTVSIVFSDAEQVDYINNPASDASSRVWTKGDSAPFDYVVADGKTLEVTPAAGCQIVDVTLGVGGQSLVAEGTTLPASTAVEFSVEGLANNATVYISTASVPAKVFTFVTDPEFEDEVLAITCGTNTASFAGGTYNILPDANNNNIVVKVAAAYASAYEITDVTANGVSYGRPGAYEISPSMFTASTEFTVTLKEVVTGKTVNLVLNNNSGMDGQYTTVKAFFTTDAANPLDVQFGTPYALTVTDTNYLLVIQVGSTDSEYKSAITSVNGMTVPDTDLGHEQIMLNLSNVAANVYVIVNISTTSGVADLFRDEDGNEAVIYNLQGVRVRPENVKAGLYIVNGKKVQVK